MELTFGVAVSPIISPLGSVETEQVPVGVDVPLKVQLIPPPVLVTPIVPPPVDAEVFAGSAVVSVKLPLPLPYCAETAPSGPDGMVTVQFGEVPPVPVLQGPLQPRKFTPGFGVSVRFTTVPGAYISEHAPVCWPCPFVKQLMAGVTPLLTTVPPPVPPFEISMPRVVGVVTVSVTAGEVIPLRAAVICVVPVLVVLAVASPWLPDALLIVAIFVAVDPQVTLVVIFCAVPSL